MIINKNEIKIMVFTLFKFAISKIVTKKYNENNGMMIIQNQYTAGERKYSRNIEILSYFTYYIISAGCFYLIHIPIVMFIGNLILFFAISFNYSATGKERILAVISIYSCFV